MSETPQPAPPASTVYAVMLGTRRYDSDRVRSAIRDLLTLWREQGNDPLGDLSPGDCVVLKPNWVHDTNPLGHSIDSLVTHTTVIEAVLGEVAEALDGRGTVIIGDAPVQSCDFAALQKKTGACHIASEAMRKWPRLAVRVEDWRLTKTSRSRWKLTGLTERVEAGDHHVVVDLGTKSFLEPISDRSADFRVTCYPPSLMQHHHRPGKHEYLIARPVLEADLVINLPKLKTHIKGGITCALKNLIGINGHKEFLPHHIKGGPAQGGDSHAGNGRLREFYEAYYDFHFEKLAGMPRPFISIASRLLNVMGKAAYRDRGGDPTFGSWKGNDTIWRTTLDMNHLLYFEATPRPRRVITIVDAIIAGEGNGPLRPTPRPMGLVFGGENPVYIDAVGAALIGYGPEEVPMIHNGLHHPASGFAAEPLDVAELIVGAPPKLYTTSIADCAGDNGALATLAGFTRPKGWEPEPTRAHATRSQ